MEDSGELPADVEQLLRAAHAGVARGPDAEQVYLQIRDGHRGHALFGRGEHSVLFHGDAVEHLAVMVEQLARSALAHGGFKADALQHLIADACAQPDPDLAVQRLAELLAAPAREWTFGEALPTYFVKDGPHALGRCIVYGGLTDAMPNDPPEALKSWHGKDFPARVITATVTARDEDSAYLRAVDAIDEAKAILWLVSDDRQDRRRRAETLTIEDGHLRSVSSGGPAFGHIHSTNNLLVWPFNFISDVAGRDPQNRTDWARRIIAAARWNYEAGSTTWPSASLTAAMSALETLLLPPGIRRGKGDHLAAVLHTLGAAPFTPPDRRFKPWFINLYNRRNDATHEGIHYDEDLDVSRLLTITRITLRWAAGHLDPNHLSSHGGPCATLEQALAHHR